MAKDKHQIPEIKLYGNAETVKKIKQALSGEAGTLDKEQKSWLDDGSKDISKNLKGRYRNHIKNYPLTPDEAYIKAWEKAKPKLLDSQKIGQPILMGSGGEGYKNDFMKARRSSHDISGIDLHYKFMENHFGRPLRDIEKNTIMQQNTEPEIGYGARAEIESVPIIKRVSLNFSFPSTKERKKQNYIKQTRHNWKYKLYLTLQELNKKKKC